MADMGNNKSAARNFKFKIPETPRKLPYSFMSFMSPNKLMVFHVTESVLNCVRNAGSKFITKEESIDDQIFYFHLKGEPFETQDLIATKHFLCDLLAFLHQKGWRLVLNSDFAMRISASRSTWFFKKEHVANPDEPIPAISCVYLTGSNQIQLINVPEILFSHCLEATKYLDGKGSQLNNKDYEITLRGAPWNTKRTNEAICAHLTILALIRSFGSQGFRLISAGNFNGQMDAMFFQSNPVEETLKFNESALIVLHDINKLWLVQCPPEINQLVESACAETWPTGVDFHLDSGACYQIDLHEAPWDDQFSPDCAMHSRFLLCVIFQRLRANGWMLENVLHISQRPENRAIFILKPCQPKSVRYMVVCPQGESRIALINGEKYHNETFGAMLRTYWPAGVRLHGMASGCYQAKLNFTPWHPTAEHEPINMKHLMCMLLAEFAVIGWNIVCSADISAKYEKTKGGARQALSVQSWILALE